MTVTEARRLLEHRFESADIEMKNLESKSYPEETIFVVYVAPADFLDAAALGNDVDELFAQKEFDGFVTVRKSMERTKTPSPAPLQHGVNDDRVLDLQRLLRERSRATETSPALTYIKDVAENIVSVAAPRHNLVFGRRGAGKSALLAEAMKVLKRRDKLTLWMNAQTYRDLEAEHFFLFAIKQVLSTFLTYYRESHSAPYVKDKIDSVTKKIDMQVEGGQPSRASVVKILPEVHEVIRRFLESHGQALYIFLDDFHYLSREHQPRVLDLLHSSLRDCNAWLKVAAIRNMTRWYIASDAVGLQTGHDVAHIDLDVTLENPTRAKHFLERVLKSFGEHVGITALSKVFSSTALNRLVLASGAVPRDYLILTAEAIRHARARPNARLVGGEDVNRAAGDAANNKMTELEEDAASLGGEATLLIDGVNKLRNYCLEQKKCSFFRIDFKDKERYHDAYEVLSRLMDLRLIHLLNASVSDKKEAGKRYEVFMLDLSQYSGHRLKRQLTILDFVRGNLVLKKTGSTTKPLVGDTPKTVVDLLRRGPELDLTVFAAADSTDQLSINLN